MTWEISGTSGMVRQKQAETVPKKMLDIELFVYGETLLVGRILQQDESLRGDGVDTKHIYNKDGFQLNSYGSPEITQNILFVRGKTKEEDNKPIFLRFRDKETLRIYVCNVKKALAEINKTSRTITEDSGVFKKVL